MKKAIYKTTIKNVAAYLICFLMISTSSFAQTNLVPNYSFESFSVCPTNYGEVTDANGWNKSYQNNVSPHHCDYMNSCNGSSFSTPGNTWGTETPATGQAYMAMCTKATPVSQDYRENIYTQLINPLIVGARYNVSMKVSLADAFMLASDKIGIKFSTNTGFLINNVSHVYANSPITSQNGWTTISSQFVADSAYSYIGVGNFFDDANTTEIMTCSTCAQYYNLYYVDDIVVTLNQVPDEIAESSAKRGLELYPNPSNGVFKLVDLSNSDHDVRVYDLIGQSVSYSRDREHIDLSSQPNGVYFICVSTESRAAVFKAIVSH